MDRAENGRPTVVRFNPLPGPAASTGLVRPGMVLLKVSRVRTCTFIGYLYGINGTHLYLYRLPVRNKRNTPNRLEHSPTSILLLSTHSPSFIRPIP